MSTLPRAAPRAAGDRNQGTVSRTPPSARTAATLVAILAVAACGPSSDDGLRAAPGSPAAPSNLRATAGGFIFVDLTWDDNSADETHFRVDRRREGGDWKEQEKVAANVTEFRSSGLKSSTEYSFRVRAGNANGLSKPSNTLTIETPPAPAGGCGLVIGEELGDVPRGQDENGNRYWVWEVHSGSEVVVSRAPAGGREEIELDGGWGGTTWILTRRRELDGRLELDMRMRFSLLQPMYNGFEGPLCLMLHDLSRGGYVKSGIHAGSRESFQAQLPFPGPVPVVPEVSYFVTIRIHRGAGTFDVSLNGAPIAAGIPLDGVLVVPSVYVLP